MLDFIGLLPASAGTSGAIVAQEGCLCAVRCWRGLHEDVQLSEMRYSISGVFTLSSFIRSGLLCIAH
jgi:hypothetical protein